MLAGAHALLEPLPVLAVLQLAAFFHRRGQNGLLREQREELARHVGFQGHGLAVLYQHVLGMGAGMQKKLLLGRVLKAAAHQLDFLAAHHVVVALHARNQQDGVLEDRRCGR